MRVAFRTRDRRGTVKRTPEGFAEAEEGHASERQPRATSESVRFRGRSRGPLDGVTAEFVVWMSYAPRNMVNGNDSKTEINTNAHKVRLVMKPDYSSWTRTARGGL